MSAPHTPTEAHAPRAARATLRVAFLIDRWLPERGGAERELAALAQRLVAHGHHVVALALEHAPGAPGEPVRVRADGLRRATRELELAQALVARADELACDVTIGMRHLERVDLYWPHGGSVLASLDARARAAGRPTPAPIRGRFKTFVELERSLLERGGARRIACVSRLVYDELAAAYPDARARLVRCDAGVDVVRFSPTARAQAGARLRAELRVADDEPLLAFAARDPKLKGLGTLLAALARLQRGRWKLAIAGVRRALPWKLLARRHGLALDRLIWRADVDPRAWWAAADLCVHPTFRDTFGAVIAEALASGTPVITTRAAGASELVRDPAQGLVLDFPGDVEALERALAAWLDRADVDRAVDRERVRSAVAGRDREGLLAALEGHVLDLARRRSGS